MSEKLGANLNTWIGVGTGVVGLLSVAMLCGMYFGGLRDLPDQVKGLSNQLSSFEKKQIIQDTTLATLNWRMDANAADDLTQWSTIRATERKADSALSKEEMLRWQIEFERKNNIPTPKIN